jgi:hypothetical protein
MLSFDCNRPPRATSPAAAGVWLALTATLGCLVFASTLAAPPTMSATQIVERNVAARGGLAAWRGVTSLSLAGKMDLGKTTAPTVKDISFAQRGSPSVRKSLVDAGLRREALAAAKTGEVPKADAAQAAPVILPFELEMKRPHKTRLEIDYNKQKAVQTFDGTAGWKLRPFTAAKAPVPMTPAELKAAAAQDDLDGMLIDYAAKKHKIAFDKVEMIDGREQYKLRVTLKDGDQRNLWIDAKTFLETRVDGKPHVVEGRWRATSTYYRDYRNVHGLMIPFVVETRTEGLPAVGKMLVESVQVNPELADARFGNPG